MFINTFIYIYIYIYIYEYFTNNIYFRPMNLNAVLDYLEELDNPDTSITICPPDVDELTNEDSADEEGDVPIGPHNLNRNYLLAQAEIDLSSDDEIIKQPPCKKQKTLQPKWELEESPTSVARYFPEDDYSQYRDFCPAELFILFLMIQL